MAPGGERELDLRREPPPETDAGALARGVCRALDDMGYRTLTEMPLGTGRRVDVIGLDRRGFVVIVEIKTSAADLRADRKWREYLAYCDSFYFAVPDGFPWALLPDEGGLIVADRYGGAVVRAAAVERMAPARRRALTVRFARAAAARLRRIEDPPL